MLDNTELWQGDIKSPEILDAIAKANFDEIVITLTPGERGEDAYRKAYYDNVASLLSTLQNAKPPKKLIFVSSTSVSGATIAIACHRLLVGHRWRQQTLRQSRTPTSTKSFQGG